MRRIIRLTESKLVSIINRVINEDDNYTKDFYTSVLTLQSRRDDLTQEELYDLFNKIDNNLYLDDELKEGLLHRVASKIKLPEKEKEPIPETDILIYHKPYYGDVWMDRRGLPADIIPTDDEYNFLTIEKGVTREISEFSRIIHDVEKKVGKDLLILYPYNQFRKLRGIGDIIIAYKK